MHQLILRAGLLCLVVVFLGGSVWAQTPGKQVPRELQNKVNQDADDLKPASGKAGTGSDAFRLSYYNNDDSDAGNPFLDEELTVVEPVVFFEYNITDRTNIWAKFSYDWVSSASIDRLSNFPAQSGASGDYYYGLDVGGSFQLNPTTKVGGFFSASQEYDYDSFGFGGHVAFDFDGHNTTIKTSLSAFLDSLDVIRFNGVNQGTDDRTSLNGAVSWYQVISPKTHGEFGLSVTHQEGFLETPYNAVVIENPSDPPNANLANMARGTEISEELPNERVRFSLYGKVRWALSDRYALEGEGRIYTDDWGISSFTLDPKLYAWLVDGKLRGRLRYRYYNQTAADDYESSYTTTTKFRTQDSDLADFDAHTLGARVDWYVTDSMTFDLGIDYTMRSDDLDFLFVTVGFQHRF